MIEAKIRLAADQDGAHLLKAVADEQDYQLPEHSRRPPKCDRAGRRRESPSARSGQPCEAIEADRRDFHPHRGDQLSCFGRRTGSRHDRPPSSHRASPSPTTEKGPQKAG
jgi:hypothetical protein